MCRDHGLGCTVRFTAHLTLRAQTFSHKSQRQITTPRRQEYGCCIHLTLFTIDPISLLIVIASPFVLFQNSLSLKFLILQNI